MKIIFILFCSLCFSDAIAQSPSIAWQKCIGGSQLDQAKSILQIWDGSYIVAGKTFSSDGNISGYHGGGDCLLTKLNANGNIIWQKCLGGSREDEGTSIQLTSDSGFILGGWTSSNDGDVTGNHGNSNDFWLVKLSQNGDIQWQKCYGGTFQDMAYDVKPVSDKGYIIAGMSTSINGDVTGNHPDLLFGGPSKDFWVVKTDSIGNLEWQRSLGAGFEEIAYAVIESNDGGFVVTGTTHSQDGGDVQGSHNVPGGSFLPDGWVVKLARNGNLLWQKCLGGTSDDRCNSIIQTDENSFVLTGYTFSNDGDINFTHGSGDAWVVKLDTAGNILWLNCFGGSKFEQGRYIEATSEGGFIISGRTSSSDGNVNGYHPSGNASLPDDFWVFKLSPSGNLEWQKCLGGSAVDDCYIIKQTHDGGYITAGFSTSNDGDVNGNNGNYEAWVVKLAPFFPIPIKLNSFTATEQDCHVRLSWKTDYEENFSRFEVEASNNGFSFKKVGTVQGKKNTSGSQYSFVSFIMDDQHYYRLKIINADTSFTYSSINRIETKCQNNLLSVYPNPVQSELNMLLSNSHIPEANYLIADASGRLLYSGILKNNERTKLNIENMSHGLYWLRVISKEKSWIKKFIKN